MAATPDRTTVKAAIETLTADLQTNLVADPPTSVRPFRRVEIGRAGFEEYARPFLGLLPSRTRLLGMTQNDKVVQVSMTLRIVTDVTSSDPNAAILDKAGALDDYLDSIVDTGVLEGADGFDDREWSFEYPTGTSGARVAVASAMQTFVVRVERQQNRIPAV